MKWLIGIGVVMVLAHFYFKYGARRLRERRIEETKRPDEE